MSKRSKRPLKLLLSDEGSGGCGGVSSITSVSLIKKKKKPITSSTMLSTSTTTEDDDRDSDISLPTSTSKYWHSDFSLKSSNSIYNRNAGSEPPAELFRKDLISAMKLPDSEPLTGDDFWLISDTWKQEWERGVQVPVKPESLPEPFITSITARSSGPILRRDFKLPKNRYVRISTDNSNSRFSADEHVLSNVCERADNLCVYDMDECDSAWLQLYNHERFKCGQKSLSEDVFEKLVEQFETRCWNRIQAILQNEEGLGIEYDENIVCDVCRSPDSEEGNEMVFCDCCNICVHQACYGIMTIPSGQWLCCSCSLGQKPTCVLCPNKGGAMKSTRSGQKWAHVSCALWIPEVSIGCVERMEPITKISSIPSSRWTLVCVLCREKSGACIQCSERTCKTAYHVTCAFKHNLEMRAIIENENVDDGVKLRSYCQRHSVPTAQKKDNNSSTIVDDKVTERDHDNNNDNHKEPRKQPQYGRKEMTSEERSEMRARRLQEIESEFDKHVNTKDLSQQFDLDLDGIQSIFYYWKLKRRSNFNQPLLPPPKILSNSSITVQKQDQADLDKIKKFVQLRQDLERVRNLCYMVTRREKLSRSYFKLREQTFYKQVACMTIPNLKSSSLTAIIEANHGPSIYDQFYSYENAPNHSKSFDSILAKISNSKVAENANNNEAIAITTNGLLKSNGSSSKEKKRKNHFNGGIKSKSSGKSLYGSGVSSLSGSNSSLNLDFTTTSQKSTSTKHFDRFKDTNSKTIANNFHRTFPMLSSNAASSSAHSTAPSSIAGSSDDEGNSKISRKNAVNKIPSKRLHDSDKKSLTTTPSASTLRKMEREMVATRKLLLNKKASDKEVDSDDSLVMDMLATRKKHSNRSQSNAIYSDTSLSSSSTENVTKNSTKKSVQSISKTAPRTKAAVKEFTQQQQQAKKLAMSPSIKKRSVTTTSISSPISKNKRLKKAVKDPTTDLIVPQRQAAKKAVQNLTMKSTSVTTSQFPMVSNNVTTSVAGSDNLAKNARNNIDSINASKNKLLKDSQKKDSTRKLKQSVKSTVSTENHSLETNQFISDNTLLYVPQRRAAKKAAEFIKSDLKVNTTVMPNVVAIVESQSNKSTNKSVDSKKVAASKDPFDLLKEDTQVYNKTTVKPLSDISVVNEKPNKKRDHRKLSGTSTISTRSRTTSSSSSGSASSSSASSSSSSSGSASASTSSVSESETYRPETNVAKKKNSPNATTARSPNTVVSSKQQQPVSNSSKNWPFLDKEPRSLLQSSAVEKPSLIQSKAVSNPKPQPKPKEKIQAQARVVQRLSSSSSSTSSGSSSTSSSSSRSSSASSSSSSSDDEKNDVFDNCKQTAVVKTDQIAAKCSNNDVTSSIKVELETKDRKCQRSNNAEKTCTNNGNRARQKINSEIRTEDSKCSEINMPNIDCKTTAISTTISKKTDENESQIKAERERTESVDSDASTTTKVAKIVCNEPSLPDLTSLSPLPAQKLNDLDEVPNVIPNKPSPKPSIKISSKTTVILDQSKQTSNDAPWLSPTQSRSKSEEASYQLSIPEPIESVPEPKTKNNEFDLSFQNNTDLLLDNVEITLKNNLDINAHLDFINNFQHNDNNNDPNTINKDDNVAVVATVATEAVVHVEELKQQKPDEKQSPISVPSIKEEKHINDDQHTQTMASILHQEPSSIQSKLPMLNNIDNILLNIPTTTTIQNQKQQQNIPQFLSNESMRWLENELLLADSLTNKQQQQQQQQQQQILPPQPPQIQPPHDENMFLSPVFQRHFNHSILSEIAAYGMIPFPQCSLPPAPSSAALSQSQPTSAQNITSHLHHQPVAANTAYHHSFPNNSSVTAAAVVEAVTSFLNSSNSNSIQSSLFSPHGQAQSGSSLMNFPNSTTANSLFSSAQYPNSNMSDYHKAAFPSFAHNLPQTSLQPQIPLKNNHVPQQQQQQTQSHFSQLPIIEPVPEPVNRPAILQSSSLPLPSPSPQPSPLTPLSHLRPQPTPPSPFLAQSYSMPATPQPKVQSLTPIRESPQILTPKHSPLIIPDPHMNTINATTEPLIKKSKDENIQIKPSVSLKAQKAHSVNKKSPAKSPRQQFELPIAKSKTTGANRKTSSGAKSSQSSGRGGRSAISSVTHGRSRGRGRCVNNAIHRKLAGTVYDLNFAEDEEEMTENICNLKAMRERKKSTHNEINADLMKSFPETQSTDNLSTVDKEAFSEIVKPVLPGPVDMRKYRSIEKQHQPSLEPIIPAIPTPSLQAKSELKVVLNTFNNGIEESLHDIDEDFEKELDSALISRTSSHDSAEKTPVRSELNTEPRNQLKVKIKGPFSDSNYIVTTSLTSNTINTTTNTPVTPLSNAINGNSNDGTSSLRRRMRKKELLRQYWTQSMEGGDVSNENATHAAAGNISNESGLIVSTVASSLVTSTISESATSNAQMMTTDSPVNRNVITIPRAVTSMASFPTKDDYKSVLDANTIVKKKQGFVEDVVDVKQATKPLLNTLKLENKRRKTSSKRIGRPPQKLRITIAASTIESVTLVKTNSNNTNNESDDCKRYNKGRPPKKRLSTITTIAPSMEDIRRENMKFRRMVMANFDQPNSTSDVIQERFRLVSRNNEEEEEDDDEEEEEIVDYNRPRRNHNQHRHQMVVTTESSVNPTDSTTVTTSTHTVVKKKKKKKSTRYNHDNTNQVQIITQETENPTKLIIRFGKNSSNINNEKSSSHDYHRDVTELKIKKEEESDEKPPIIAAVDIKQEDEKVDIDSKNSIKSETNSKEIKPLTPIRLKIARCQEGFSYVMKKNSSERAIETDDVR